ncbi:glycosyltransferase [Marinicrinis sediminis]|uniref:Glycosyltransferase n=1 Tax=Marinicrinis sediminis TaxID=1652465 RepID=A0ABW5RDA6_9BACL
MKVSDKKSLLLEGPLHSDSSFAHVNRELWKRLVGQAHIEASYVHQIRQDEPMGDRHFDLVLQHQWPPRLQRSHARSKWMVMQPWEFGSMPRDWYIPFKYEADEVWVYSRYNRDCYIQDGIPAKKIKTMPLGFDETIFHPAPESGSEPFTFLFVGGSIPRKGIDLVLQAYCKAFQPSDDVRLIIKDWGTNSFYKGIHLGPQIQALAAQSTVPPIVYRDGRLTAPELASLYRRAHCLVHPYRGEGFGLPLVEAMACGIPVIVPDRGPSVDMMTAEMGYLISSKLEEMENAPFGHLETISRPVWIQPDLDHLIEQMRHVVAHREEARDKGVKAAAHMQAHFTWSRCVDRMAESMLEESSQPAVSNRSAENALSVELSEIEQAIQQTSSFQLDLAQKLVALHTRFPEVKEMTIRTGLYYLDHERYDQALVFFERAKAALKREDPLMSSVQLCLVNSHIRSGDMQRAIQIMEELGQQDAAYRKVLYPYLLEGVQQLSRQMADMLGQLGQIHEENRHWLQANECYTRAVEVCPSRNNKWQTVKDELQVKWSDLQQEVKELLRLQQDSPSPASVTTLDVHWLSPSVQEKVEGFSSYAKWPELFPLTGTITAVDAGELDQQVQKPSSERTCTGWIIYVPAHKLNPIPFLTLCQQLRSAGQTLLLCYEEPSHTSLEMLLMILKHEGWIRKEDYSAENHGYMCWLPKALPVLWQSPLYNQTGYASEQQHFMQSLRTYPIAIEVQPMDTVPERQAQRVPLIHLSGQAQSDGESKPLIHIQAAPAQLFTIPRAPISIARTMFETDRIPEDWVRILSSFSEVWVPSAFNVETFERSGLNGNSLHIIPGTLDDQIYARRPELAPFPLQDARSFVFLSVFDWSIRKGWDVLLRAYFTAFDDQDDVTLVLKVSKVNEPRAKLDVVIDELKKKMGKQNLPAVKVIDQSLSDEEMLGLYVSADAFVLPTRGEGWGRPFMEAMAMELPVIGTRWSGHLAFMNDTNSYLIETERLTEVDPSMPRHFYGHRWAEPSAEHLSRLMKDIYARPEQAAKIGKVARASLFPRFSKQRVGAQIYQRFCHLLQRSISMNQESGT